MPTFNSFNNQNNNSSSQVVYDFSDKQTKGTFLSKVFGMMFICLLITTVVAAGFGYGFQFFLDQGATIQDGVKVYDQNAITVLMTVLIIDAIALLIMSFVLPIMFVRGKHNILVPLMIYVVLMGVLLSAFTFLVDWVILVEAFGITTIIFGVMGLLGYVSKGRMAGIGVILLGLIIGAGLLCLLNWVLILTHAISTESSIALSWVVSLMVFAFLMLITMYDVYRIKKIAENGASQDNNLVNYCAYILYSDFIAILIRVIYFLAIMYGKRR